MPNVIEVLTQLKEEGHTLTICSNTNLKLRTMNFIERTGIVKLMDHVTYSWEVGARKPNPDVLNDILEKFPQFEKDRILFIGDKVNRDILCAKRAGIRSALFMQKTTGNKLNMKLLRSGIKPDFYLFGYDMLRSVISQV